MKHDNRLSWGVILIFFGILFLTNRLHLFPNEIGHYLFDYRNYPLYAGVIFLATNKNRVIGIVLLAIGLLFRLSDIIQLTRSFSEYVWPLLLILAGIVLLVSKNIGRKR